ncbi:MAG: histidinol dehydrogenase [Rhodobacteraceae bacterium]|nr:MAG: histidinol dehydrogenase [Paracoccaceae bacterium]|tara:strand:- start:962 stop:2266 length:1305 start_codon:yes stop_codon:yes gene_type:complete
MGLRYLKRAIKTGEQSLSDVRDSVQKMLIDIEKGGDIKALDYAKKLDNYDGKIILSPDDIGEASEKVPKRIKDDIQFAYENVKKFAEAQKKTLHDFDIEVVPDFITGQKYIPCNAVGCYIPGGRYSHVASAIMTVTTAKVARCRHISACSPPRANIGINPAIIYTANLCGADTILAMGGVQAISSMAYGLFGLPKADILVGPGNQYVAEAKRLLFGRVGLDMVAGPTDSLILADKTADAEIVAIDLVGQAEHGYNSPVWLVTDDSELAEKVLNLIPKAIEDLPKVNKENAEAAWRDFGEVIICSNREEMASTSDDYAPEHLSVQASDLDWWLDRLKCYGSLFLGEETTVAYGDKASGTNHVLPTARSARYTGGLSVHKYMKVVTWQRATREGSKDIAQATARISRTEGMEGHARTADIRLKKYFPNEKFDMIGE